jgi:hypothetical protein
MADDDTPASKPDPLDRRPVRWKHFEQVLGAVTEHLRAAFARRDERIAALEARIAALEARHEA